jgi:hypothetical protein
VPAVPAAPVEQPQEQPTAPSALATIASQLDTLAAQAAELGEPNLQQRIVDAAKAARWADKVGAKRKARMGNLVAALQAKGLTPEQILAQLTQ